MLVSFENVSFAYRDVPILQDGCFSLHENESVGFIGGNGEGKTTLLRLLLNELVPDEGSIFRKNNLKIGYLPQNGGLESEGTVFSAMSEVFEEDRRLIARLERVQTDFSHAAEKERVALSSELESLQKRIDARDSYHVDVRIRTVLNGMGFEEMYDQVVSTMSGGEKTRLKLCRLLLEGPELLILDEPTNHLDIKTLFWLEDYLSSYRGAMLLVSHDRYFLDRLTSRTLELERGKVLSFKGNYSKYKVLKEELLKQQWREYEKQQEEIAKLQDYIDRNLVRATTAKSALSRVNQLERMEKLERPAPPPKPPRFIFEYDTQPYERVIEAHGFDLTVDGKLLIKNADLTLLRGEKCALTGENGTGKTTLLKYLLHENETVRHGKFVRIGYYDQENADLDPEERVLDAFWGKNSLMTQTDARKLLAQAGIEAEDVNKKVKELSGGLRAKLELALLESRRGNVLFLDEPTNHLDLPAREALEEALKRFDGTILFVSHDRRFIEAIANKIALIENNELTLFAGGYQEFLNGHNVEKKSAPPKEKAEQKEKAPVQGYRSKEERAREAKRKQRTKEIEQRLEALESEEAALNEELAARAADYTAVKEITAKLEALRSESDALYVEYETLI